MSLRFIYGKSGTGKTKFCFQAIKKLIKEQKKVYMITPEQFSFTAEKYLMLASGKNAVLNAEVITFKRMAYRILNEVGGIENQSISECGKAMLLSYIIEQQKQNLKFLGKTNKNLDIVLRMLTEFKKNNITTALLNEKTNALENPYIELKLKDINLIYEEFEKACVQKYLDEEDLLILIKDKVKYSKLFQDSYIYIDEFSGFTKQEYAIIEELLKIAEEINVTICTDSLKQSMIPENDIFAPNKNTILKLKEIAEKNTIFIQEPILLKEEYRYQNEELKYLVNHLYAYYFEPYPKQVNNITLFLANNRYSEIENVASQIIHLVRDQGFAFKDISIITREMDEYASLMKSIFAQYEIPVFLDEKKDLSQNSLIKYVLSILEVFAKSFRLEEVIHYLKSGMIENLTEDEIFLFENYCKKYGITGLKKMSNELKVTVDDKDDLKKLNDIRETFILPLIRFKDAIGKRKTVKDITKLLYTFLEERQIIKILTIKMNDLKEQGKIDLAKTFEMSWNAFVAILDELVLILGDQFVSFEQYAQLLKVGVHYSTIGKIPATLDEVIVGDVDRTRSDKKKVIFIIGLNDGKFPSSNKNEGFINDEERIYLKQNGLELAKTTKEQLYDENFNIYKAFGVPEEKLFLSYIASDEDGKGLRKSILISKIKKIFPLLTETSDVVQEKVLFSTKESTFDRLLLHLRKYLNGEKIDPIWIEIYAIYKNDPAYHLKLQNALKAFSYNNIAEPLSKDNLQKLYGNSLETSISKLESYQRCPFSYFLQYGLKLSDRTELKLEKLDTGTFMHDIIDSFFEYLNEQNIGIKTITEEEIETIIENLINTKLSLSQNYIFQSKPQYIVLTKRLKKVIVRAIGYIVQTLKNSDFQILGNEIIFGKGKTYAPITMELEDGKTIEMTGKIDRIDVAENEKGKYIRIIDYKSSVKNIDLNQVMAGIQIQLITYLDAVTEQEKADAAGIFYFNLIESIIKTKNKHITEEELEQEIRNQFKMNGFILGDVQVVKMMDNGLKTGASSIIPAYLDKEGNLSMAKSNVVKKEDFKLLQNKVESIIKQVAKEIMKGNIQQKPIYLLKNKQTACEYCSYQSICRFNPKMCNNNYRFIPNLSKNEILSDLKEDKL